VKTELISQAVAPTSVIGVSSEQQRSHGLNGKRERLHFKSRHTADTDCATEPPRQ
jgi:hypothetical protein